MAKKPEATSISGLQFFYDKVKNSDSLSSKELKDLYNKAKMIDESLEFKRVFDTEVVCYSHYQLSAYGEDSYYFELNIPINNGKLDSKSAFLKVDRADNAEATWDNPDWLRDLSEGKERALEELEYPSDGVRLSRTNRHIVIKLMSEAYEAGLLTGKKIKIY